MGIYTNTYICFGKIYDINNAQIASSQLIQSLDPIIEQNEWNRGYVYKNELITCLEKSKDNKVVSFVEKIKQNLYEADLFLQESMVTTLDIDTMVSNKYIKIVM